MARCEKEAKICNFWVFSPTILSLPTSPFCSPEDQTQDPLRHTRQVLYHWTISPAQKCSLLFSACFSQISSVCSIKRDLFYFPFNRGETKTDALQDRKISAKEPSWLLPDSCPRPLSDAFGIQSSHRSSAFFASLYLLSLRTPDPDFWPIFLQASVAGLGSELPCQEFGLLVSAKLSSPPPTHIFLGQVCTHRQAHTLAVRQTQFPTYFSI